MPLNYAGIPWYGIPQDAVDGRLGGVSRRLSLTLYRFIESCHLTNVFFDPIYLNKKL